MFHRSLTFLSFGLIIRGGGSHRTSFSTSGFQGPGSGGLCPDNPPLCWFSVGLRRLKEGHATGFACLDACSCFLTRPMPWQSHESPVSGTAGWEPPIQGLGPVQTAVMSLLSNFSFETS